MISLAEIAKALDCDFRGNGNLIFSSPAEPLIAKKDQIIKNIPLYAAEDLKKVNFFKSLITSLNYLIWGDV